MHTHTHTRYKKLSNLELFTNACRYLAILLIKIEQKRAYLYVDHVLIITILTLTELHITS